MSDTLTRFERLLRITDPGRPGRTMREGMEFHGRARFAYAIELAAYRVRDVIDTSMGGPSRWRRPPNG
jgi:hypothetical protein